MLCHMLCPENVHRFVQVNVHLHIHLNKYMNILLTEHVTVHLHIPFLDLLFPVNAGACRCSREHALAFTGKRQ